MIKKIIARFLLILAATIVLLAGGFFVMWLLINPRGLLVLDRSMDREYQRLELGSSTKEAIERLGPPKSEGPTFLLPQRGGFEDAFERAEHSAGIAFYLWTNGPNWYYCLGFDNEGGLVVKEEGHD